jgi:hypothetical protein
LPVSDLVELRAGEVFAGRYRVEWKQAREREAERQRLAASSSTKRSAGIGLLVGGLASFGLVGVMIGWRESTLADVQTKRFASLPALERAVENANTATGLAVASGVLGAALVGVAIPLLLTGPSAPAAKTEASRVWLRVGPDGLGVGGGW